MLLVFAQLALAQLEVALPGIVVVALGILRMLAAVHLAEVVAQATSQVAPTSEAARSAVVHTDNVGHWAAAEMMMAAAGLE
jgi:hypothetical protein